jgi:hypothetical protein
VRTFEHVQKANDVILCICSRVLQRVADSSLGGQMYRVFKLLPRIDFLKCDMVANIELTKLKPTKRIQ